MNSALIVDNDSRICEILTRWLATQSKVVVSCRTFENARKYLTCHTPDLLVTEIRLDEYNGLQLVAWMKNKEPTRPCVVVTGHDDPVIRREAEKMHAQYLLKPLGRKTLLAAIKAAVAMPEIRAVDSRMVQ